MITTLRYRPVAEWLQIIFLSTCGAGREKGCGMRREWELEDLIQCWTLDEGDAELLVNKSGATRLGFALMLKFFELEARFPRREDVPKAAVEFMAGQVKVDPALFAEYRWSGSTIEYHRAQIREFHGFREVTVGDEAKLIVWLAADMCPVEMSRDRLRSALPARCREVKVEPPAPGQVERLLGAAESMFERDFTIATVERLPAEAVGGLEELIATDDPDTEGEGENTGDPDIEGGRGGGSVGGRRSFLQELKEDPGPLTLDTLLAEIVKLERVKALKLPEGLFEGVSEKVVAGWRARAMKMYPSDFGAAPQPIRITLLAALCWVRRAEMIDGLVELLIQLVHKISVRAERKVESEINSEFRRGLPKLLRAVSFHSGNDAFQPVMDALALLDRYADSEEVFYGAADAVPLEHVVPEDWREAVVDEDNGLVERIPYELCVLVALRKAIRRREIWVDGGNIWRNPDNDLPADFEENRDVHYQALSKPRDPAEFIADVQRRHVAALDRLNTALKEGTTGGVRITRRKGEPWISVPPVARQVEPASLKALKEEISRRWGVIDLLDLIKETDHVTQFTSQFTSVASRTVIDPEVIRRRLLLCLYGLGTNVGIKRVADGVAASAIAAAGDDGRVENEAVLRRTRRLFINRDNLRAAIRVL